MGYYNICKFLTYNLIWLTNDIIDNNYKLLLQYSVYYAGDGLDRSSVNSNPLDPPLHETKLKRLWAEDDQCSPAHCHWRGEAYVWMRLMLDRFLVVKTWLPALLCGLVRLDLAEQLRGVERVGRSSRRSCVCTILYSPSSCVSPPPPLLIEHRRIPVGVCIWHLYKCTSLKTKWKPWHIWNKWGVVFLFVNCTDTKSFKWDLTSNM